MYIIVKTIKMQIRSYMFMLICSSPRFPAGDKTIPYTLLCMKLILTACIHVQLRGDNLISEFNIWKADL